VVLLGPHFSLFGLPILLRRVHLPLSAVLGAILHSSGGVLLGIDILLGGSDVPLG